MSQIKKLEFIPQKQYMEKALQLAEQAGKMGDVPVGAVIEKNGVIVGTGRNRREEKQNALCHAEIEAIHEACQNLGSWRLSDCCMYVTLVPCPMCAGAILNARIDRVVFGADDEKLNHSALEVWGNSGWQSTQLFRNFMQEECQTLLKEFFSNLRDTR
ncbi:nucleoside deaminase [Scatolibacter rhodanostii]|uniref:nucleoside deaminase n=1 Tax=Scatolibacter rhodanostii TaxID=2014781 RepID=UPI000C07CF9D|nr:nucleoside deaminase [Scatolibacter rhodanostii]